MTAVATALCPKAAKEKTVQVKTQGRQHHAEERATPVPSPAKPSQSEGDKLALQAADILQDIVLQVIYADSDDRRNLHNVHIDEVEHLLGRLLNPKNHERDPADPDENNILDHLALISSELEAAIDVMEINIPGMGVAFKSIIVAIARHAAEFSDRLFLAYQGLPGTIEDLRALTTVAGAKPLYKRAPTAGTPSNISTAFQAVANALDSAARTDEPHEWSGDSDRLLRIGADLARRFASTGLEAKDVGRCAHDVTALVKAARLVPGDTESQERAAFLEAAIAPLAWLTEDLVENVIHPGALRPPAPNAKATEDAQPEKTGVEALLNTVCGKLSQACATVRSVLQVSDYGTHYHGLLSVALDSAERALDRLRQEEFSADLADSVYQSLFPIIHCMNGALALAERENAGIFIGSTTEATQLIDEAQNALDIVMVDQALKEVP